MKLLSSRKTPWLIAALLAVAAGVSSCGDDDGPVTPGDEFVFATDAASAYVRVDRMGMPAVATAVITSKASFNAADPVNDAQFAAEITTNVGNLHTALDDDLAGLGLTPCATNDCIGQAAPFVVPDVIRIDTAMPSGFPNGRGLTDRVIDVTLALVLLDLDVHSVTTFAGIPVNPGANDLAFLTTFPYLAPMNTNPIPDPFLFATNPVTAYSRVDRMGMPAVATAVITSKGAFNAGNPVDDAAFAGEITTNVGALHTALDDDLAGLGLTPCATAACVGQAAPFVVPDVLRIDTATPSGFPNGRGLTDRVIDVTLALVLLDLSAHSVGTFASIPVNPGANDAAFLNDFPYLAAP